MLTFWAVLEEPDVEAFVGTLLLPSYMSYLRRAPVRFVNQPANVDGQQPIIATYLGDGRMEEFAVHPKKHALGLLQFVCPNLDSPSVRINPQESIWNWSVDYRSDSPENADDSEPRTPLMRLYFEPVSATLPLDFPKRFDPQMCYVSVSRKELFIGRPVLQAYCGAWIDHLEAHKDRVRRELPELHSVSGGVEFQGDRIGGEFLLEDDVSFRDLLHFAGLDRSLKEISELAVLDLERAEIDVDDDGFRFRLVSQD